jgi:hypothetical protein
MTKMWLTAAMLVSLVAVAGATDLDTEVGELETALQARIDAGAGGKELKLFNKVKRKLDKTPTVEVKDLKKVLGGVAKSGTADAAVLKEAADVLDCLCKVVQGQEAIVLAISVTIPSTKFQGKVQAKLDGAKAKLDFAKTFIATNPAKATNILVGAYAKYLKAGVTANKLFAKAQPKPPKAPPKGFSFSDQFLVNNSGKPHNLKQIKISVEFLDDTGQVLGRADANATALLPDQFQDFNNRIFPGFYDFGQFLFALFQVKTPPEGTAAFSGRMTFTVGNFANFDLPLTRVPIGNFYFPG